MGRWGLSEWGRAWVAPRCAACGQAGDETAAFCAACQETVSEADDPRGLFLFGGAVKTVLRRAKFGPDESAARHLCALIADAPLPALDECDAVTFVPIHRRRLLRRGFDLSAVLAATLATRVGLPLVETLRCQRLDPPRALGAPNRVDVAGKFAPRSVAVTRALLVDDVFTTGATMTEAMRVLADAKIVTTPLAFAVAAPPTAP